MLKDITFELSKIDWSGVSGITSIIMVFLSAILLLGIKQGSKNIKEASLSRDADILRWAMSEMDKLKPQIKLITDAHKRHKYCNCKENHTPDYTTDWTDEELDATQTVGVNLQRIGYMALHNLISRNHFMNIWGPMYLSSWYALEGWVKHKRLDLNEPLTIENGAYSRMYLEQYALYCENNLPTMLVNNERKRFNLPALKESNKTIFMKLFKQEKLDI